MFVSVVRHVSITNTTNYYNLVPAAHSWFMTE